MLTRTHAGAGAGAARRGADARTGVVFAGLAVAVFAAREPSVRACACACACACEHGNIATDAATPREINHVWNESLVTVRTL